jgi:hypothetical protein
MRNRFTALLIVILVHCSFAAGDAAALAGRLQVDGSEFVLQLDDGRILRRAGLLGLTLRLRSLVADGMELRIIGTDEDETAPGGKFALYRLASLGSGDGPPVDLCHPDVRGRRMGFPLPDEAGGFQFVCTSGAAGKCVLMGYRPWETSGGVPMRALHRACVHMLRADYGGDDRPTTRNGTAVDVYDRFGIQMPAMRQDMSFEAAWSEDGAVCVAHPRIIENITLGEIAARYDNLAERLGPQICTEDAMRASPNALLFNRSVGAD